MAGEADKTCPQCKSAAAVAKVNTLYHNGEPAPIDPKDLQRAEAVNAAWSRSKRWVPDMQVTNRKLEGIVKKLAPPLQPNAAASGPQDVWASGALTPFGGILFTIIIAALFGGATLYWSIPLTFIVVIISTFLIVRYRQAAAARMMPEWEKAMDRWEEMYYCANCDGVFLPWERVFVPVAHKDALAYKSPALKLDKAK